MYGESTKKRKKKKPRRVIKIDKKGRKYVVVGNRRIVLDNKPSGQTLNFYLGKTRAKRSHKQALPGTQITNTDLLTKAQYLSFLRQTLHNEKQSAESILKQLQGEIRNVNADKLLPEVKQATNIHDINDKKEFERKTTQKKRFNSIIELEGKKIPTTKRGKRDAELLLNIAKNEFKSKDDALDHERKARAQDTKKNQGVMEGVVKTFVDEKKKIEIKATSDKRKAQHELAKFKLLAAHSSLPVRVLRNAGFEGKLRADVVDNMSSQLSTDEINRLLNLSASQVEDYSDAGTLLAYARGQIAPPNDEKKAINQALDEDIKNIITIQPVGAPIELKQYNLIDENEYENEPNEYEQQYDVDRYTPDADDLRILREGHSLKYGEEDEEGSGKKHIGGGLWSNQLEKIMSRYPNFVGVYPADKISEIKVKPKMGFIMNLSTSKEEGTHWVAVYIDTKHDRSIEYYDSFGRDPSYSLMKQIKTIVNELNPDTYLKFKVNRIKQQSVDSSNCGIFAAKFLMDRFEGIPFQDCTCYSDVANGEKMANHIRHKFEKFGYI